MPNVERIAEDARLYRKQVRPLYAGRKITREQEGAVIHRHVTNRGLKVVQGDKAQYAAAEHVFVHPTPEDHSAVGWDYFKLMNGAVKLARKKLTPKDAATGDEGVKGGTPAGKSEHDALHAAARASLMGEHTDPTPFGIMADHLEDNGRPGAHSMREGAAHIVATGRAHLGQEPWFRDQQPQNVRIGNGVFARPVFQSDEGPGVHVTHVADSATGKLFPDTEEYLTYGIPVRSRHHLVSIMRDWTPEARAAMWQQLARHLPSKHADDGKPLKLARREIPGVPPGYWIDADGKEHYVGSTMMHEDYLTEKGLFHNQEDAYNAGWHKVNVMPQVALAYGAKPLTGKQKEALSMIAIKHRVPEAQHLTRGQVEPKKIKLARHKDLQKHERFWHMLNAVADNHDAGVHEPTAHGALADAIGDFTGDPSDPRAHVIRGALEQRSPHHIVIQHDTQGERVVNVARFTRFAHDEDTGGTYHNESPTAYTVNAHTGMEMNHVYHDPSGSGGMAATYTVHVPRTKSSTGNSRTVTFHHVFRTAGELHRFIDKLPKASQAGWRARAEMHGHRNWGEHRADLRDSTATVFKFARPKKIKSEHDALLDTVRQQHDHDREYGGMLPLADKMQEEGNEVGAALLKMSRQAKANGETPYPALHYSAHLNDHDSLHRTYSPDGKTTVRVSAGGPDTQQPGYEAKLRPIISVTHLADDQSAKGVDSFTHHFTIQSLDHLHEFLRTMPFKMREMVRRHFLALHREHPMVLPSKPTKLARTTQGRQNDAGAALANSGSKNHDSRLKVARKILDEAGLSPSDVRAAIAHDGTNQRASVVQVIRRAADAEHTRYAAAWRGVLLNEPGVTVFHPDEGGEDFLHVITSASPPDYMAKGLSAAGVPRFVTEHLPSGGSRAYVVNPLGKYTTAITKGLPDARHSVVRGRNYRIGSGSSSNAPSSESATADQRAAYRTVIDDFERAAGGGKAQAEG